MTFHESEVTVIAEADSSGQLFWCADPELLPPEEKRIVEAFCRRTGRTIPRRADLEIRRLAATRQTDAQR
jgi:hypothetical protein